MDRTDSPHPPRRVRLSFLAPAILSRFDAHGRLKRGLVVGLSHMNAWPLVLWDDEDLLDAAPVPPEWLETANRDAADDAN